MKKLTPYQAHRRLSLLEGEGWGVCAPRGSSGKRGPGAGAEILSLAWTTSLTGAS